jgi:hypothetical protein
MKAAKLFNIISKIALVILLFLTVKDLFTPPLFEDVSMVVRFVVYSAIASATYIWYKKSDKSNSYPHFIDACLTLVVASDLFGNVFGLYDGVWWWDDAIHLVMVVPWVLALGYFLLPKVSEKWVLFVSVLAYGLVTSILWEIFEFTTYLGNRNELAVSYPDTMLDITLSLVGTVIGGVISLKMYENTKIGKKS